MDNATVGVLLLLLILVTLSIASLVWILLDMIGDLFK